MATRKLYEGMVHFRTIEGRVVVFPGPDPARTGGTKWAKVKPSATSPSGVAVAGKVKPVPSGASKPALGTKPAVKSLQSARVRAGQWKAKGGAAVAAAFKKPVAVPKPKPAPKPAPTPKPAKTTSKAVKPPPPPKTEPKLKPEPKPKPEPKAKPEVKPASQPKVAKGAIDPKWQEPADYYTQGFFKDRLNSYMKDRGNAKADAIQKGLDDIHAKYQTQIDNLEKEKAALEKKYEADPDNFSDAEVERHQLLVGSLIHGRSVITKQTRELVKSVLAVKNPTKISVHVVKGVDDKIVNLHKEATDFIGSILHDNGKGDNKVMLRQMADPTDNRAFFNDYDNAVTMSVHNETGSFVHEMGHWIDHKVKTRLDNDVLEESLEFLNARTKGEASVSMWEYTGIQAYRADERGRPDKFGAVFGKQAAYVGKDYGGKGSEIVSMGIEKLYRDPAALLKDKEYAGFIFGILDGSLR